jgi:DnaJ family protein A protein 2
MDPKDKCKQCKGHKLFDDKKVMEIPIERGVPSEHDYVFHDEGDEYPDVHAGDLVIKINIKKHTVFTRKGADLYVEKKITILEALTGCSFEIKHLDDTILKVHTVPKEVISHLQIMTIKGKGMPFYRDNMSFGNLFIKFTVNFPKRGELSDKQIQGLKDLLPGPKYQPPAKNENVEYLDDFHETDLNPNADGGRNKGSEDYDDEDPRGGGAGQKVQCQQQ